LESKLGVAAEVAERCNLERRLTSTEIGIPSNLSIMIKFIDILKTSNELPPNINSEGLSQSLLWVRDSP
jgi:hypothetical protein